MNLQGKRDELLQEVSDMEQFRMQGTVMDIYDDRNSAKDTLKLFKQEGWIEVVTHGVFEVTDAGRKKAESQGNGDKEKSLDSF